ncbi:hypothetical protein F4824DRAFT_10672 [Ustulina deusta]|nr:hypothetical protein F4824DRAFT_10672 [Ustulina deusta]
MSSKRKFSEFRTETSVAGETRERTPKHQSHKRKKRRGTSEDKPTSTSWLKKRARTIERRLNHTASLPANVQHDLEKELDHHKQKLDDIADMKKRSVMIKKYHMVRFFERKKADRLVKQIRTQLESTMDEEERKKLQADLHIAEVDALYTRYFPHRERYVSLYPVQEGAKTEDTSAAARSLGTERPPIWGAIEEAAKKGNSALVQIQERKPTVGSRSKPPRERPSTHLFAAKADQPKAKTSFAPEPAGSTKRKGERQQVSKPSDSSSDDDSDGGFFEEG